MSARANYFKIGIFVLAGFFILAGTLIFLGAGNMFRPRLYFETYVDGTVQGVDQGSPVKFRGVQIGRISKVDFCFNVYGAPPGEERKDYVYLEMEVDKQVFRGMFTEDIGPLVEQAVQQGLRVKLQPQGVTGLNFAELNYVDDPRQFPPLTIWWTPKNFYIPSAPGTLTSLVESLNKLMDTFGGLELGPTLKEVDRALKTFNTTLEQFSGNMEKADLAKVSADLQGVLADLKTKVDKLPVEQLSADGQKMMQSLTTVAGEMQTLVDALQTSPLLNADAVGNIIGDFQATAENFRVLSENLREYPSQLLFGEPPKRSRFDPAGRPRQ
ncbi:MAG: MlaD family protein [Chthoniobacterales bacterium]